MDIVETNETGAEAEVVLRVAAVIEKYLPYVAFANVIVITVLLYLTYALTRARKGEIPTREEKPLDKNTEKICLAALILLTIVYSVVAFHNLGNAYSPQTMWTSTEEDDSVIFDFGEIEEISQMRFFSGLRRGHIESDEERFMLYASVDGLAWDFETEVEEYAVLAWHGYDMNTRARYVKIAALEPELMLMEAVFFDADGEMLTPVLMNGNAEALLDEQHMVPDRYDFMNSTYYDEIYFVRTAYEFILGMDIYEATHPPLGKDIIALSIKVLGVTPFAWRLPGVLAGILMIPLIFAIARMMTGPRLALLAAFLLAFDFMHFAQTRIGTTDSFLVLFITAMYAFMYAYYKHREEWRLGSLLTVLALSGVFMGMAISVKWSGIYAAGGLAVLFFIAWRGHFSHNRKAALATLGCCVLFFVAVPVAIYLLSYIPLARAYVNKGYEGSFLNLVVMNQTHMFTFHAGYTDIHAYSSNWWEWPLIGRPKLYYAQITPDELVQGISTFGNPAIWWGGIAATVWALFALRRKIPMKRELVFLLVAYAFQFLPWIPVPRYTFIYHYFPSVPFIVLLITMYFKDYLTKRRAWRLFAYATVVIVLFVMFYPVLSAAPVPYDYIQWLRWLPKWTLALWSL
jgi:4-amino-4-deoxy-L-arabinose transferase-like glycosyltransferase